MQQPSRHKHELSFASLKTKNLQRGLNEYEALKAKHQNLGIPAMILEAFAESLDIQQRIYELASYMGQSILFDHRGSGLTKYLTALAETMIMVKHIANFISARHEATLRLSGWHYYTRTSTEDTDCLL